VHESGTQTGTRAGAAERPYQEDTLPGLLDYLEHDDAEEAWDELFNERSPFGWNGRLGLRFTELLYAIRGSAWALRLANGNPAVPDAAIDIMLERFGRPTRSTRQGADKPSFKAYPNRRFRTILKRVRRWEAEHRDANPLEKELAAAEILQRCVVGHFKYACREASRRLNGARSRYAWRLNGKAIVVWMPVSKRGSERRTWLECNIETPDPSRPGEAQRVQTVIDERLGIPAEISLGDQADGIPTPHASDSPLWSVIQREIETCGLVVAIANEKAKCAAKQRKAIRALGPSAIRDLVLAVFDAMAKGSFEEKRLAARFCVSRATLSRFCGSRWDAESGAPPPDLWLNLSHLVARQPVFVELAKSAGVWPHLRRTVQGFPNPRLGSAQHD